MKLSPVSSNGRHSSRCDEGQLLEPDGRLEVTEFKSSRHFHGPLLCFETRSGSQLVDPEFVAATGGGEVIWSIATKITCPDKTVAKREFWNCMRDELFVAEWDLLL